MSDSEIKNSDENSNDARKLLFVIKAKEKSSTGFESFLRNRNWDVVATSDLKLALSSIFSRRIHCVLITVEHANPHCMKLPGIIAQTSKTPVILFAEGLTTGGINALRGSEHPYIIAPPVSGPAIERMVLRIEKEMSSVEKRSDFTPPSKGGLTEHSTIIQKGAKYSEKDFLHLFESDRAEMKSAETGTVESVEHGYHDSARSGLSQNSSEIDNHPGDEFSSRERQSSQRTTRPHEIAPIKMKSVKEFTRVQSEEQISILDRAASFAIKGASVISGSSGSSISFLDRNARVGCLQVDSPFFAGMLVVAFAGKRADQTANEDAAEFMLNFKTLLLGYLNDEGVTTSMFEVPEFCLNEISFEEWALSDAKFLRKSIHQQEEVGVSFFPHQLNALPLRESEDASMSRIDLQELREDVALAFDVYLYLPVNKKYIRYAVKERFLYDSQRDRLNAGGVKDVHIKRDSEKDVARYRLQIGLNDKIRSYAEKKGA